MVNNGSVRNQNHAPYWLLSSASPCWIKVLLIASHSYRWAILIAIDIPFFAYTHSYVPNEAHRCAMNHHGSRNFVVRSLDVPGQVPGDRVSGDTSWADCWYWLWENHWIIVKNWANNWIIISWIMNININRPIYNINWQYWLANHQHHQQLNIWFHHPWASMTHLQPSTWMSSVGS